jgi:hypothetical protein
MTRKDYELIARSIRVDREKLHEEARWVADLVTAGLADQFEAMNPRFNRGLFLDACGHGQD